MIFAFSEVHAATIDIMVTKDDLWSSTGTRKRIQSQLATKHPKMPVLFGKPLSELEDYVQNYCQQARPIEVEEPFGDSFVYNTGYIVPVEIPAAFLAKSMQLSIVVDRSDLTYTIYRTSNGKKIEMYTHSVGLGKPGMETPSGNFYLTRVCIGAQWVDPDRPNQDPDDYSKPGVYNMLGKWMADIATKPVPGGYGFNVPHSLGTHRFHGVPSDLDIGDYLSRGCIRIHPTVAEEIFPALLRYTPHADGRPVKFRGTVYPLKRAIPFKIQD